MRNNRPRINKKPIRFNEDTSSLWDKVRADYLHDSEVINATSVQDILDYFADIDEIFYAYSDEELRTVARWAWEETHPHKRKQIQENEKSDELVDILINKYLPEIENMKSVDEIAALLFEKGYGDDATDAEVYRACRTVLRALREANI